MTDASGGAGSRAEIERTLVQRSLQDEDFRRRLLADPRLPWSRRWWVRNCQRALR
jgi:hypothetical protein